MLNSKQAQALQVLLRLSRNFFLTGVAGAGKSFLLRKYISEMRRRKRKIRIAAPTGIAAQQIGGITLAKLLGLRLAKNLTDLPLVQFEQAERNLWQVNTLILDEVSMISGDMLALVDHVMREVTGKAEPFGGIQMVFSGDFLQLPPVFRRGYEDAPKWPWAFEYPEFHQNFTIYLEQSMRNCDPEEMQVLNEFRQGILSGDGIMRLCQMAGRELDNPISLFPRRKDADWVNQARLNILVGEPAVFPTRFSPSEWKTSLLAQVPIGEEVVIKEQAPVVILENDPQGRYVNGSQGKVEKIVAQEERVLVRLRNNRLVEIRPRVWEIFGPGHEVVAQVEGLPLHLGWAATIHRAQGLTLDAVKADLRQCWDSGHAYVALSRTRSLQQIALDAVPDRLVVDPVALSYMNNLSPQRM